jgi:hypothetical protein
MPESGEFPPEAEENDYNIDVYSANSSSPKKPAQYHYAPASTKWMTTFLFNPKLITSTQKSRVTSRVGQMGPAGAISDAPKW